MTGLRRSIRSIPPVWSWCCTSATCWLSCSVIFPAKPSPPSGWCLMRGGGLEREALEP